MRAVARILVVLGLLAGPVPEATASPNVFVVDTTLDDKGTCAFDGNCSLYEAINAANLTPNDGSGPDVIEFAIPGPGPHTIQPSAGFLNITDPVVIDGGSQGGVGYTGPPLIVLDGQGTGVSGLWVTNPGAGSTIRGLSIVNSTGSGIQLGTGTPGDDGGNIVVGTYIGVLPDGTTAAGNASRGVWITASPDNIVGGPGPGEANVISGNQTGILVIGAEASGNEIAHNRIGTTADGSGALGNTSSGVLIQQAGQNVVGPGNVISGNATGVSVSVSGDGNQIRGNLIGTNAAGTAGLGNGASGVQLSVQGNVVGGPGPGEGNVIAGNGGPGVSTSASDQVIQGNLIGTNASGDDLGNGTLGVHVFAGATGVTIGGTGPGEGNTIAFNGSTSIHPGVDLRSAGPGNTVLGNSIYSNAGLGIDLGATGVTMNDAPDADGIPNFPVLSWAIEGSTAAAGRLTAEPGSSYRIEVFEAVAPDDSGNGEGDRFLGAAIASIDLSGSGSFIARLPDAPQIGSSLTMTSTRISGGIPVGTSEFSEAVTFPTACHLTGTDDGDVLQGGPSDEVLCGLGGDDLLIPSGGMDAVMGGPGADTVLFSAVPAPVVADLFKGLATDAGGDLHLLVDLEHMTGTSKADVLRGDGRRNVLKGKGGADLLVGRGGRDLLAGGQGPDRLRGGPGNDVLRGQGGNDRLDGGPGNRDRCRQGPGKGPIRRCER